MAMREGKPLPEGWAIDRQGRPTIDAEAAMLGSILPAGGHKGMGIAMMVPVLSGVLAGTADTLEQFGKPPLLTGATGHQSAFFWFIRQNAFISAEDFAEQMIGWASHYTSRSSEARLPGTRGAALEARCEAQGLALEGPLLTRLRALGERVGVPLPTPLAAA